MSADNINQLIRSNKVVFFILIIFTLAAHGTGIFNGYTWDDNYLIPQAERLASVDDISSILKGAFADRQSGSSGADGSYYRPFRTLVFVFALSLPGPHTIYLHSFSILLHILVSFMVFSFAVSITKKRLVSLLGALLFAVHPVVTESVAGISNVKEILSSLFVLITIYYLYRIVDSNEGRISYSVVIAISALAGHLSKETALVIPIVAVLMLIIFRKNAGKLFLYGVLPVLAVTVLYMLVILYLSPGPERGEYILGSPAVTLYTTSAAFMRYIEIIFWPADLSVRHDIDWILTPLDWHVISVVVLILLLTVSSIYLMKKKDHRALPLVFFFVSLLPLSNIVPIIGHLMSERYMYMPLSAACLAGAVFLKDSVITKRFLAAFLLILIALTVRSTGRTFDWKNDTSLFDSAVKIAPDSLVVRWNLHRIYFKSGEEQKARHEYDEMLRINREMVERYVYFAKRRDHEGNYNAAKKIWDRAEYSASGNPELIEYVRKQRYEN